jgi:hypothetical protein
MVSLCGIGQFEKDGAGLVVELTAVLMQLLAVRSVSTDGVHGGSSCDDAAGAEAEPLAFATLTAAEAVEALHGTDLTWEHLDKNSMSMAGYC